jgi:FtsP/CotA-like multicopper oxidase with cupredoxin domain
VSLICTLAARAQGPQPCPRFLAGSSIMEPEDLFSSKRVLEVNFTYQTRVDDSGNRLFCFMNSDGAQSPTLHVHPGDQLIINFKNALPPKLDPDFAHGMSGMAMGPPVIMSPPSDTCGAVIMTDSSVNIHYHGTNTPPVCHQDEVIKTLINAGQSFRYSVQFPPDEPPGLYWYHPHVHGLSERAVQGGASGAIVVEGLELVNPIIAGMPSRVMVIRDNPLPGDTKKGANVPGWDISLNYIPIAYPKYVPVVIPMRPNEKQFWRVVNASADTFLDLQLRYDDKPQPLQVVALDGVPVNSQDGSGQGKIVVATDIPLSPAARAEFIVTGPAPAVHNATLLTLKVDTGPVGDNDPQRPVAVIETSPGAPPAPMVIAATPGSPNPQRFAGLATAPVNARRKLYFSEGPANASEPDSSTNFFITVDGQKPVLFNPNNPPAIVTTQGSVEDWTIENRTLENHAFHIHQIHFLFLARNGVAVPDGQYLDMIDVPYWTGHGPYPNVTVRMDFRGPDIGDFVYHCHILEHEDGGMMAIIRVKPH